MNMDIEYIKKNKLSPDDTFDFKCRQCGKCCHNRDDLLLTGWDIFRISKLLGKSPLEIITKNCEVYIGDTSQIPVVHILPKPHGGVCPFLRSGRCSVHAAKPVVCAVFPLARIHSNEGKGAFYVLQEDVTCGDRGEIHTVRDWLDSFGIPTNDTAGQLWSDAALYCATLMMKRKHWKKERKDQLWGNMYKLLYLCYDTELDFEPQLSANLELLKVLTK